MSDTMLDRSFRNAYGSARAHSMLQSSCATLPLPASPVLSLRSGIVGGVSLSEVLHYARRTQCFSPTFEHTPTSPNHEITPSSLEVVSIDDFRSAKISKSGSQSVAAVTKTAFRFVVAHWRFYRTFRFCGGQNHKRAKRAVGGCLSRNKGSKFIFDPL